MADDANPNFAQGASGPADPYSIGQDLSYLGQAKATAAGGAATVAGATIQHNEVDVAVEPRLDFKDGDVVFTVTDNAGVRVKVEAALAVGVAVRSGLGSALVAIAGSGSYAFDSGGLATISFAHTFSTIITVMITPELDAGSYDYSTLARDPVFLSTKSTTGCVVASQVLRSASYTIGWLALGT